MNELEMLNNLGPWHMKIKLSGDIYTTDGNKAVYDNKDFEGVQVIDPLKLQPFIHQLYPGGLRNKTFFDVGCNAGGYCFIANQLGADFCYGVDVRAHWINQAEYLRDYFGVSKESVRFEVGHIDHIIDNMEPFDITLFKGIFYHLPNPIHTLERMCQKTKEVLIFDSNCRTDITQDALVLNFESESRIMSGVDRLAWYPSGLKIIIRLLEFYGFNHNLVVLHKKNTAKKTPNSNKGRFRLISSRDEAVIERFKNAY